jgi:HlyD family secretion protein
MDALTWNFGRFLSAGLASPAPSIPSPTPSEPAPAALPPAEPKHKKPRRWLILLLILLLAGTAAVWNARQRQMANQARATAAATSARVFRGPFQQSIRVSGTVGAKSYAAIIAPRQNRDKGGGDRGGGPGGGPGGPGGPQMTLVRLAAAGSTVKKDDVIAVFDVQFEVDHADDVKDTVVQLKAAVDKRSAEIGIEYELFRQQLRAAGADAGKAELDLKTAEVRSQIDAEKLKLAVEETAARYKQLAGEEKLRQTSYTAETRALTMQAEKEQSHLERHVRNIEKAAMKAPIGGLVVMQPIFRSGQFGQVQEGDQIFPGTYFMQIVDLSQMVLNGSVNQTDSHLLALGQKASVHLEAYPDVSLPGRVISVGAMATSGAGGRGPRGARDTYVKQIPIRVSIESRDSKVLPDLSGSADVVLQTEENALQVPRDAVIVEGGKTYVRVRQGDQFARREVHLGESNNTHYLVRAGLNEGDEVLLR